MKTPQKTHHTYQRTPNTKTTDSIHTSLKQNIKYMKKSEAADDAQEVVF